MADKKATILLSKILSLPDVNGKNKKLIDIIIKEEIPILCVNGKTNKERLMPFKVLHDNNETFWQQGGDWSYSLDSDSFAKLKEKAADKTGAWDMERPPSKQEPEQPAAVSKPAEPAASDEELEELEPEVGYGREYKAFADMTTEEKLKCLNDSKKRLNDLLILKSRSEEEMTEVLVDTTKDAVMINHAVMDELKSFADDEAKALSQVIVNNTNMLVKSSAQLITEDIFNSSLMNTLVQKSNGTIVQHMTRVYLNGVAFLAYYNNLVTTTSSIQKLRISFASKYREFYSALLPHVDKDDIDLERVFLGGMRAIPPDMFFNWSIGFLIHDIGKASAVDYHEGEAKYDRNIVIEHVKEGYKYIVNKTNYPMEASLIVGYHHEYYGNPAGYGYFRAYLQQYKKQNQAAKQDHCISYELEPMLDYKVLSYFPAKVLEIIDVYDSVTDPNRIYRKAMTPAEALTMMRNEFIIQHRKIDIILFDIFSNYINEKEQRVDAK